MRDRAKRLRFRVICRNDAKLNSEDRTHRLRKRTENKRSNRDFFAKRFGMVLAISELQLAPEVIVLEPTLMVVGLNHRTASLAMRERFWIGENRRYEAMRQLRSAEGIEEVAVLCTRCRTEFLVWASEPTTAANTLLQFLSSGHGLKLSEWQHFYRLLDSAALTHIFRVASGLDSLFLGEPQIAA